jgi:hypothetical protein
MAGYVQRAVNLLRRLYAIERERNRYAKLLQQHQDRAFPETIPWGWSNIRYSRLAVVTALAARKPDGAYLEIGCFKNDTFDAVAMPMKVGVDPEQGGTVRATSDDFFATNTQRFDLVFIDGLHTYDQVHRDVANSLKAVRPGGHIVMHDMLPGNWIEQNNPRLNGGAWTGDTWKVGFELLETAGIDFRIVTVDHGVGVIRVDQPGTDLVDLSSGLTDSGFEYFFRNRTRLPLASWDEALPWMRSG